ncbi:hypothetical protein [Dinoroseobacter shibae]|jgi:hypothetical protein|uniref:hypothetical protein n=1 Tax=Dinoroseobacter shibae TaxID=215813 RepID=UPI0003115A79|nr:hypothetical protein [Dinoroseobacter shibae]URF49126.1 hypothetical protein M8008_20965 [Dinoroseobacter shibae]URF53434.1 hypothetical protein M8007_20990 [Dinoroseobacter shibae]
MNFCAVAFSCTMTGERWVHYDQIELIVAYLLHKAAHFIRPSPTGRLGCSLNNLEIGLRFQQIE